MLVFVFKINKSANSHDGNSYHYNKKPIHAHSSFVGVIATANEKTTIAMIDAVITVLILGVSLPNNITAPIVVNKYFTRSNNKLATFSFLREYLSFMSKFKHMPYSLSNINFLHE